MKLLNITIYGFGRFSNYTYDFNQPITVIDKPNSYGKTTIAQFIKAMFYGLGRASTRTVDKPREKYNPWGGGQFGGELTFLRNANKYTIIRTFGAGAADDEFKLFDQQRNIYLDKFNGQTIDDKGRQFGEILFGISEESFEKINFIQQLKVLYFDADQTLHSDINTRLRELFGETSEDNNYEKAKKNLEDAINDLNPKSRRRAATYVLNEERINTLNTQINASKEALETVSNLERALNEHKVEKEANQKALKDIDEKIALVNKKDKRLLELKNYQNLLDDQTKLSTDLDKHKAFFKDVLIEDVSLSTLNSVKDTYKDAEKALNSYKEAKQIEIAKINETIRNSNQSMAMRTIIMRDINQIKDTIAKNQLEIDNLHKTIKPFKALELILSIITFSIYYFIFKNRNNRIKKAINNLKQAQATLNEKLTTYQQELDANKDSESDLSHQETLLKIKGDIENKESQFQSLKETTFNQFNQFKIDTDNIDLAYHKIESNYNAYFQVKSDLEKTNEAISTYDIKAIKEELETYQTLNSLDELNTQKETLNNASQTLIKTINSVERDIKDNQEIANNLDIYEVELEDLKDKRITYEQERHLLEKTLELLNNANQQLAAKYLKPLESKVNTLIENFDLEAVKVRFDGNSVMQVKPSKTYTYKDFNYFSTGYQDLMSILVRIALIGIVYDDVNQSNPLNPFIIFDDSFVNFDDENIKNVKPLLEKLSKKHQIIYFTCSNSRNLNNTSKA